MRLVVIIPRPQFIGRVAIPTLTVELPDNKLDFKSPFSKGGFRGIFKFVDWFARRATREYSIPSPLVGEGELLNLAIDRLPNNNLTHSLSYHKEQIHHNFCGEKDSCGIYRR